VGSSKVPGGFLEVTGGFLEVPGGFLEGSCRFLQVRGGFLVSWLVGPLASWLAGVACGSRAPEGSWRFLEAPRNVAYF
jgi:hypothetical protein